MKKTIWSENILLQINSYFKDNFQTYLIDHEYDINAKRPGVLAEEEMTLEKRPAGHMGATPMCLCKALLKKKKINDFNAF